MPLLVRFADNPEQKRFKSGTSTHRQSYRQGMSPHFRTPSDTSGLSMGASNQPDSYETHQATGRSLAVVSHSQAGKSGHSASSNTVTNSNSTVNSTSIPGLTQSPISDSNSFRSRSIDISGHGGIESRRGSGFGLLKEESGGMADRRSPHARTSITARRHSETSNTSSRRASMDSPASSGGEKSLSPSKQSLATRSGDMGLLLKEMNELEVTNDDETADNDGQNTSST